MFNNAALVKSEVKWDNIDDARLTAEQVADLALDLVDNDLLADMEAIDLSILGELRLNSIDNICADITKLTGGFVWSLGKGLLGDLGDMDFSAIKNKSRTQGDVQMILNVLALVGNDNTFFSSLTLQLSIFMCSFNKTLCKCIILYTSTLHQTIIFMRFPIDLYMLSVFFNNCCISGDFIGVKFFGFTF